MGMKSRIKRIFSNLDKKIDAFIIANSEHPNIDLNFFYVSGITSGVFEHCYIIAYKDGKGCLLTTELEEPIAKKETKLKIIVFKTKEEKENHLKKLLLGVKKLGINADNLSYKQYKIISKLSKAKLSDMSYAFTKTRSIKDKNEIETISKACKISSLAANEFSNHIKGGVTEKQLLKKLVELQYNYGATNLAFSPIIAFGKNSSKPHHYPTNKKINKNEFVLIDFGAEYNRYSSDISRTFVFGKASKKMRGIYDTVLDAQLQAIDMIKDSINGKDVNKLAHKIIDKKFKGRFIHSLGHGVGLSVHDGHKYDLILKKNMVITIEPGVYIPSFGGVRIEDTVLVTKGKAKVLTKSPKGLINI